MESKSTFEGLSFGTLTMSNELLEKVSDNRWWLKINNLLYYSARKKILAGKGSESGNITNISNLLQNKY